MPKVSKQSAAHVDQFGPVEDRHEDVHGYTIDFLSFSEDIDAAPMMKGLPNDSCSCPHWGYVLKGRLTFRFPEHDEVVEAGDAFYLPPGHIPAAEAGSEYVQFSPSKELRTVAEAMQANMQRAMPDA
jgi:hypothetical protein